MQDFIESHLLSLIVFTPTIGALFILLLPRNSNGAVKAVAVLAALLPLLLCIPLVQGFHPDQQGLTLSGKGQFQFVENRSWIEPFHIRYTLGVDGLSLTMVVLTALLSFLCIFASWDIEHWKVNRGVKGYFALFLLLETGMAGVFTSLDFFLFYVFWEVMLLPMYFLIGIWGGPRREYAAIKFFLYTLAGSVLMLIAMLALYFNTKDPGTGTYGCFSLVEMMKQGGALTGDLWKLAFLGLFIGFAIKVPVFPFHTWLPDAHVEAPTPISVILAGVLLKMGTYGLMRISFPILPDATRWFAPMMMFLGMFNILYGAFCAMAQIRGVPRVNPQTGERFIERDWKKMIAYSSVSHMGYCLLGMAAGTPAGMSGALFQMWNHGCITAMLFLLVGVVYDRAHHRDIQGFGGLWTAMPKYGVMTALAFMASLGLPGLSGFVSEVLCFIGGFQAADGASARYFWGALPGASYWKVLTGFSVFGVVLGAGYFLWSYEKIFLGPLNPKYEGIEDMNFREKFTLWPLAAIVIVLGIFPGIYLDLVTPHVGALVKQIAMPWSVSP